MMYPTKNRQKTPDLNPDQKSRRQRLDALVEKFQQYLHLPNPGSLLATLGTVAANRLEGDPVWLLLVGAPSNGKTEIVRPVSELPDVYELGDCTQAGLLSGSPLKERAEDATGGVLFELGDYGILCCKDFTTVLRASAEKRAAFMAALGETYDGAFTRRLGTDGGRTLQWKGKAGFGVVPVP